MKYNVGDRIRILEGSLCLYGNLEGIQNAQGYLTVSEMYMEDIARTGRIEPLYGFLEDENGRAHWWCVEENSELYLWRFKKPKKFELPKPKVDPTTLPNYEPPVSIRITPYFIFIFIISLFYRRDLLCLRYRSGNEIFLTLGKHPVGLNWSAPVYWFTGVGEVIGNEISGRTAGESIYIDDIILIKRYDKMKFNKSSRYKFKL